MSFRFNYNVPIANLSTQKLPDKKPKRLEMGFEFSSFN